jgi:hypothetical protein
MSFPMFFRAIVIVWSEGLNAVMVTGKERPFLANFSNILFSAAHRGVASRFACGVVAFSIN